MKKIILSLIAFATIVSAEDECKTLTTETQKQLVKDIFADNYKFFRDESLRAEFLQHLDVPEQGREALKRLFDGVDAKCLASLDLLHGNCRSRDTYLKSLKKFDAEKAEKFYDNYTSQCSFFAQKEGERQAERDYLASLSPEEWKARSDRAGKLYDIANNIHYKDSWMDLVSADAALKTSESLSRTKTLLSGDTGSGSVDTVANKITAYKVNSEIVDATAFDEASKKGLVKDSNAYEVKTKVAEKDANKGMNASTSETDIAKAKYTKQADDIKKTKSTAESASKSHSSKRD